jgi:small subunit ribosomal protein S21
MLKIKIKKGENINSALKRLKRKFKDVGVLKELRKRKQFDKPSAVKRKAKLKAIKTKEYLDTFES